MKRILIISTITLTLFACSQEKQGDEHKSHEHAKDESPATKYTCPMHPQIIQDGPGKCPLCGMTLVPLVKIKTHDGHKEHSSGIADFKKRFYVVLILTIPIMLLSDMIQHWLNFQTAAVS